MRINKEKEYAVSIYFPDAEYWDAHHIKSCIVTKAHDLVSVIMGAHKQLQKRVHTHKHTPETFYYQICDIEASTIGRYAYRNGKAKKIA